MTFTAPHREECRIKGRKWVKGSQHAEFLMPAWWAVWERNSTGEESFPLPCTATPNPKISPGLSAGHSPVT